MIKYFTASIYSNLLINGQMNLNITRISVQKENRKHNPRKLNQILYLLLCALIVIPVHAKEKDTLKRRQGSGRLSAITQNPANNAAKPNVLFIAIDDLND